ncbi:MAG TPA: NAD(P)-dependent alcohol dehydrogenase [Acidobacteriota bacterium]|nr:NAD(P)-dependent alcohol dehydrogenase [Acidobacteriota bacterium]HMZ81804.1 NAD(P)-dependent alcohol dehydrogenase [Acidobacteriota bacterium]HNB71140.1 NAD(P)-dependent alcohol dehydrogenase [Acidobacteriota bacterium]HNC44865.1 NAD(P)-dependent alcohol dehydrogenase [Acidobacteriota bacterium]HND19801.1 NAD(P)-dependent alcohol dehydrogenase [Acidobacteriota bacterium]
MKAWEIRDNFGLENLKLADRAELQPGPGQVLVRVRAVSLNYRDLMVSKGWYNPKQKLPLVPCSDGAGEVVAIGEGVKSVKPGDRVMSCFFQRWQNGELSDVDARSTLGSPADGMLREFAVLEEFGVIPTPSFLTDVEASTLPCAALTAWQALVTLGKIKAGDTVLVQGTGGVSIFALQFAVKSGARVIATSSSDEKLQRAIELGASDGINYKTTPNWEKRVRELTGGIGVDHVVEVGGAGTLSKSVIAVRRSGTVSLIGVLSGPGDFNPLPILMNGTRVQGIFVGSRSMFADMNRAIELHKIHPVVSDVFAFDQSPDAFQLMERGGHFGKICISL